MLFCIAHSHRVEVVYPAIRAAATGRFNRDIGGTSISACLVSPVGKYSAQPGSTRPIDCPPGRLQWRPNLPDCITCSSLPDAHTQTWVPQTRCCNPTYQVRTNRTRRKNHACRAKVEGSRRCPGPPIASVAPSARIRRVVKRHARCAPNITTDRPTILLPQTANRVRRLTASAVALKLLLPL